MEASWHQLSLRVHVDMSQDSVPLFWLFTVFVVFSGITLLNMLIGVLCQAAKM